MNLFKIDFKKQTYDLIPPDKRVEPTPAIIKSLLWAAQYVRDLFLASYREGTEAIEYTPGSYNYEDQVIYNNSVYQSLENSNTADPTDTTKWRLIQSNFIGSEERAKYNGHKLNFEYALNKWFHTVYRQPPDVSDTYIENTPLPPAIFRVGGTEAISSSVSSYVSSEFVFEEETYLDGYNYTIWIDHHVYDTFGTSAEEREQYVRNFADKYNIAGLKYQIQTY